MSVIQVLQIGMGPLGIKMATYISERNNMKTVAAVDLNPALTGRRLEELAPQLSSDVIIRASIEPALLNTQPDVAILTTVSDMERITPQLEAIVSHGIPVVSTCEELSFPWDTAPDLAQRIDQAAKANAVAVVGTGVNPGFLMDALPSFLTSVSQKVERIEVSRIQDASFRRVPFQKKIGAGLNLSEFEQKKQDGSLRHVGLTESIQFIANQFGWTLDKVEDIISPVVATEDIQTDQLSIVTGDARGVYQVGKGWVDGEERISLYFRAAINEPTSYDEVKISGTPNIHSKVLG
ncbi:MAG: dihydrodipicolinate reductase, partial [Bacteroidota bacterium]